MLCTYLCVVVLYSPAIIQQHSLHETHDNSTGQSTGTHTHTDEDEYTLFFNTVTGCEPLVVNFISSTSCLIFPPPSEVVTV